MTEVYELDWSYDHPKNGSTQLTVSRHAITTLTQAFIYAGPAEFRKAIRPHGVATETWNAAIQFVQRQFDTGWVLGCSGFATAGYDYAEAERILSQLYQHLSQIKRLPNLVIDGGMLDGVLGLNGQIAASHKLTTLGCVPYNSLGKDEIAPRSRIVVWGATYRTREELVGTLADALVCADGADGTLREAEAAARQGSVVLLITTDNGASALANTYASSPELRQAAEDGRLFICRPGDDIATIINRVLAASRKANPISRPIRLAHLKELFAA